MGVLDLFSTEQQDELDRASRQIASRADIGPTTFEILLYCCGIILFFLMIIFVLWLIVNKSAKWLAENDLYIPPEERRGTRFTKYQLVISFRRRNRG